MDIICVRLMDDLVYIGRKGGQKVVHVRVHRMSGEVRRTLGRDGDTLEIVRVLATSFGCEAGISDVIPVEKHAVVRHGDFVFVKGRWRWRNAGTGGEYCPFVFGCLVEVNLDSLVDGEAYFVLRPSSVAPRLSPQQMRWRAPADQEAVI